MPEAFSHGGMCTDQGRRALAALLPRIAGRTVSLKPDRRIGTVQCRAAPRRVAGVVRSAVPVRAAGAGQDGHRHKGGDTDSNGDSEHIRTITPTQRDFRA